jgi:hypothetical protein
MLDLGQFMRINLKLSVKHIIKTIPKPNKCEPAAWDIIPWEGQEKHLHDLPIHPCVSRMWKALFSHEQKKPLKKLMVAVNSRSSLYPMSETLSKKDLVESLDHNFLHIENQRARIERLEEACKDIVDDMRHSNRAKKTNIPETFVTRLDHIEKELSGIYTYICNGLCDLQNWRFGFVPREAPKESSPKKHHQGNRQKGRGREINQNCGANHTRGVNNKERLNVILYALDIVENII